MFNKSNQEQYINIEIIREMNFISENLHSIDIIVTPSANYFKVTLSENDSFFDELLDDKYEHDKVYIVETLTEAKKIFKSKQRERDDEK